jgi:hypothetical protein
VTHLAAIKLAISEYLQTLCRLTQARHAGLARSHCKWGVSVRIDINLSLITLKTVIEWGVFGGGGPSTKPTDIMRHNMGNGLSNRAGTLCVVTGRAFDFPGCVPLFYVQRIPHSSTLACCASASA